MKNIERKKNIESMKNVENVTILRVHHLLCSVLFQGKGYSEEFTENMTQVVRRMKSGEGTFLLVSKQDAVCAGCPNRLENGGCALDDEKPAPKGHTIEQLDQRLAQLTGLELNGMEAVPVQKLMRQMEEHVSEAVFDEICGECRWYRQGICSYQRYRDALEGFTGVQK